MAKPIRTLSELSEKPVNVAIRLYGTDSGSNCVFKTESNLSFIDVLSVGPIGGVVSTFLDDTNFDTGEFPKSTFFNHLGDTGEVPWAGVYPYVERSYSLNKQANADEKTAYAFTPTSFTREVSSKGVKVIKLNFTSGGFTHADNKNRKKVARAYFVVEVLDTNGAVVATKSTSKYKYFYAKNPIAMTLTIKPPVGYEATIWTYKVTMYVMGFAYGVAVNGAWRCSSITELYHDSQTYKDIAFVSGTIVADDVSGRIPKRNYITNGYLVKVPQYTLVDGKDVFTGIFQKATSDSHAWNALAVLTDTKWGGKLPVDKINLVSFLEFERYCAELINGKRRYDFSIYLTKGTNFFKLAAQLIGAADGKLYEDTSGRIAILIDKQVVERRVITTYDVLDEKVKRTTVSNSKKYNYIAGTFDDKDNKYEKTITTTEDSTSITANGLLKKELKLETCTDKDEADRTVKRLLTTSQHISESYGFSCGYSNEDLQIGDIVEMYDRRHSRIDYCGKVAAGSTISAILVDPRTPIDLSAIDSSPMQVSFWDGTETKRVGIISWNATSLTLSAGLVTNPAEFLSFGVSNTVDGLQPTLIKVMGVDDKNGKLAIEGVAYNDSLYDHIESSTPLVVPTTRDFPDVTSLDLTNLSITKSASGLAAIWDVNAGSTYSVSWSKVVGGQDPVSISRVVQAGVTSNINAPLEIATYTIRVSAIDSNGNTGQISSFSFSVSPDMTGTSPLPAVTGIGAVQSDSSLGSVFEGRAFSVGWLFPTGQTDHQGFILRVSQGGTDLDIYPEASDRTIKVPETQLNSAFGTTYGRSFTVSVRATDGGMLTSAASAGTISNPAPVAPLVAINTGGDLTLTPVATLPVGLVGAETYVWQTSDPGSVRPGTAVRYESNDQSEILLGDGAITHEDTSYNFETSWVDDFGPVGAGITKQFSTFGSGLQIPQAMDLLTVVGVLKTSVNIAFEHDGNFLVNATVLYRITGTDAWVTHGTVFTFPAPVDDTRRGYDSTTQEGFLLVEGLAINSTYEFKTVVSNVQVGTNSDDSNIIIGSGFIDVLDAENALDLIRSLEENDLWVTAIRDIFGDADIRADSYEEKFERVTKDSAMSISISVTDAKFGGSYSASNTVASAFADEANARATLSQTLIARADAVDGEIARVEQSGTAAIGYCVIASTPSGHGTQTICETAGGTWVKSALATAVNNVQVVDGSNTLTVGTFYEAFNTLDGELTGRATFGINANGEFTGLDVIKGINFSKMVFKAGGFEFKDSAGNLQFAYVEGVWQFAGTVKIGGTILDQNNTLNSNTTAGDVGLDKVDNDSTDDIRAVGAATSGTVGGWTLSSSSIYSGEEATIDEFSTSGITFHAGGAISAKEFLLKSNGDAEWKGTIFAEKIVGDLVDADILPLAGLPESFYSENVRVIKTFNVAKSPHFDMWCTINVDSITGIQLEDRYISGGVTKGLILITKGTGTQSVTIYGKGSFRQGGGEPTSGWTTDATTLTVQVFRKGTSGFIS